MKKIATQTQSNPQIKRLYLKIRKTASQLDKMLLQMHKLMSKQKSKSKKRRLH